LPLPEVLMRPRLLAVPALALALAVAACGASTAPGWTYAPPTPPPTPGPAGSAIASIAPSAVASVVASDAASAGAASGQPSAGASGAAGGAPVVIEALNIAYTTPEVSAPASVPFVIHFRNGDAGTPHNVEIKDSTGASVFKGTIVNGVIETDYQVGALAPGTYPFVCSVHPSMTGTLKVGG
jgi:plastocyanin